MSFDQLSDDGASVRETIHQRVTRRTPSSRTAERVGLVLTAVLLAGAFGFVGLYWLQTHGYAQSAYWQFLSTGRGVDATLGTSFFGHPSVWHSFSSAIFVGVSVPLVGTYLVHSEQALLGETLAHTAFAGVAVGVLIQGLTGWAVPLEVVALVVAVVSALGLQWLLGRSNAYGDVPLAIVLVGSFAVGTLLISYGQDTMPITVDVEAYLFGSLAIVTGEGARLMAGVTLVVGATVTFFYKQLLFVTFDSSGARAARLDVTRYETLILVVAAMVVVGAMQVLGVILVAGLLVAPAAAASQVATSFRELLVLSVLCGEFSVVVGFVLAFSLGVPSGGAIVSVAICVYLLALVRSTGG